MTSVVQLENPLKFYSKSADKEAAKLSNFLLQVQVGGKMYKTGEHAFHACKFECVASLYEDGLDRKQKLLGHAKLIETASTPLDAKKLGGRSKCALTLSELNKWNSASINVQRQICEYKLARYPCIRNTLIGSKDRYILHQENRGKKPIWGGRIDKKSKELIGQNILGKIWMELRNTI